MTWRLRLIDGWLRRVEKPWLARSAEPQAMRVRFERTARLIFRDPPFATVQPDRVGGVPALWVRVRVTAPAVLLYFHGGGYVFGSPRTHCAMAARISALTGCAVCLPDYRLAPEHPFPAAFADTCAAWDGLLARGYSPGDIALGGDSAGGGLALALLGHLCRAGAARPAAAVAFSPWTDLTLSGQSIAANARSEALLPAHRIEDGRDLYLGGRDPADPRASPLFGDFPDCPPVLIQASRTELLRDDAVRMADRLEAQGAHVTLDLWPDAPHVWQIFQGWLPEADAALARATGFLRDQLSATSR
ncbi:alpha/beta hydrolase [Maritimibacter sp. 55A14]|uniref:alpha/beta hydrolase n=1 Tax=Maritimibacter sp. 55A14 TaxID=2174844 RepID=UPI000D610A9A|nr:alpha/beta hydrolase [Maritimibacter sp. 55A14]PWE31156.1 alpha/beta hydrolase [Maritimibacter sp. 55A14]